MAGYQGMSPTEMYNMTPTRAGGVNTYLNLKKQFMDAVRQNEWKKQQEHIQQQGQAKTAAINQGIYTPTYQDMGVNPPQQNQPEAASMASSFGAQPEQSDMASQYSPGTIHPTTKTKAYQLSPEQARVLGKRLVEGTLTPGQLSRTQKSQALEAAYELDPNYDATKADINYAVNKTGASGFEKLYNNVTSFEKTFRKNADVALQMSDSFDRSKIPLINRAIMAGKLNITGDPQASKFATALYTVATEYARLTSAPGATGSMITDSAREEARNLLGIFQNTGTIRDQLDPVNGIMSIDAKNRIDALNESRDEIQSRYSGKKIQSNKQADPLGIR